MDINNLWVQLLSKMTYYCLNISHAIVFTFHTTPIIKKIILYKNIEVLVPSSKILVDLGALSYHF